MYYALHRQKSLVQTKNYFPRYFFPEFLVDFEFLHLAAQSPSQWPAPGTLLLGPLGNSKNFVKCGDAAENLEDAVVEHHPHPLAHGGPTDVLGGRTLKR